MSRPDEPPGGAADIPKLCTIPPSPTLHHTEMIPNTLLKSFRTPHPCNYSYDIDRLRNYTIDNKRSVNTLCKRISMLFSRYFYFQLKNYCKSFKNR